MRKFILIGVSLVCCLTGCASMNRESVVMHGMFVNESRVPLSGVNIYTDETFLGKSNSNGFFEIEIPSNQIVNIEAKKSGWENKKIEEPCVDTTKLYIYQMDSLKAVYGEIEKALINKEYQSAEILINDLESKYNDTKMAAFFKSVLAYKNMKYENAISYLLESEISEADNPYVKSFYERLEGNLWKLKD